ncbi:thiazole biosynthetic enzyme [Desulfurobacterium thermolithotrophum DSM 11699]|uniref:Thiamine thiazole synthase n=1 Tax=Desulfurobacterium thermolithotrophum (strain DSM 11699 / BSA) TaxID=868864 RepID=F0S286_DESTD|nr:sulfide-dependent adenosine diphosphate thiazole synthase [Desulfurobacterium thermolithotrophum]ADY74101.1 thiazole biosynthetic enzyme [Desulfurobacterium thermolithotrophum DSM 11699]
MQNLNEVVISQAIIESYMEKLKDHLEVDVAIVGGGPSGLVAGYYLAKEGFKVSIYERRISIGGGMWAGAMFFNEIVVQEMGREIFDEFEVNYKEFKPGYYLADAVEAVTTIASKAVKAGAVIFNGMTAEDVVLKKVNGNYRVCGLVINWSTVEMNHLMVDPLVITSKYVIDATGHDATVVSTLQRKAGVKLATETGCVVGEKPLWASVGEEDTVKNSREVFPGIYVSGMAANATCGSHRMGPVFGGMLMSGKKVAQEIAKKLRG